MTRSIMTLVALLAAPATAWPQSNDLVARIDSFVSARVQADAFSGAVLFADRSGIRYQRAAGLAHRDRSVPITTDTRLQIASATKLYTHIAIRQLEQQGKLAMSDTVGRFLPDYPNPVVRSKVTVEQLIRHRSGVGSFWNEAYMARRAEIRTVRDYLELFHRDALLFEPGTGEAYSNGGYVILGAIIERVSGQSYHDYLRDHVLGPAGMTHTMPYDSRGSLAGSAVGFTAMQAGPLAGDRRLAGPGAAPRDTAAPGGQRMRMRGPDGRELSAAEVADARARRAATPGPRRPNTDSKPGLSGPAGDHFSTVADFLRLAQALTSYRLLDSTRTAAVLGARYARGEDFIANGGSAGVNAEFSIFPTGEVVVVLSNYDPPSATEVAQFIRSLVRPQRQTSRTHVDGPERVELPAGGAVVPLEKLGDFYFAEARLGGVPFRFTVETGANHVSVSQALVERLGLRIDSATTPMGTSPVVRLPPLSLGAAVFHGVVARVVPGYNQEPEFHGLISIPLVNSVVATFDFPRRELRLGGDFPESGAIRIDYQPGRRVSVPIVIGGKALSAVLDTRASFGLIVPDSLLTEIRPAGGFGETIRARGPTLGDFSMRPAQVPGFTVGGQSIPEATVYFRDRPGVVLGLLVMEQFVLTLDLARQRAALVMPSGSRLAAQAPAPPAPRVYLGFGLVPQQGGGKTVAQVAPGSSAAREGLLDGDQIVTLDGVSAAEINPAVMRQAAAKGVPIRVVVQREGKTLEFGILPYERR
jgi:CubicO group peptidase (beta-lactamase class C family)